MINHTECDLHIVVAAKAAYEAYTLNSGGLNYKGDPCPLWIALPDAIRSHWCAAVLGVLASEAT